MTAFDPATPIGASDRRILRELARRYRDAVDLPRNQECVRRWRAHDVEGAGRPLILTETDGGLSMVKEDFHLQTEHPWARHAEGRLWEGLIHFEMIGDDYPLEPFVNIAWPVQSSGCGVEMERNAAPAGVGGRGAFHIDPALPDFPAGLEKLRLRTHTVDRAAAHAQQAALTDALDGLVGVRIRNGSGRWSYGPAAPAIYFVGLDGLMLAMYDEPDALHQLMAYLRDDLLAYVDWMEAEGLLGLNNENDYVGSGSRGYTALLPTDPDPDVAAGRKAPRAKDLWCLIESQETVGIGPSQYAEFIFPYEEACARRFGMVYYGCCEPVNGRWETLSRMTGLRRVSVSPWCDEEFCAEAFGKKILYSRKPNPTLVSTERFDTALIREDLRKTMRLTRRHDCRVEIVMKDVHTLSGEADRLRRWVDMAREVTTEIYG